MEWRPLDEGDAEDGREECFSNAETRCAPALFRLEIEKAFRERRHDEENEDCASTRRDAEERAKRDEDEEGETHDGENDGDFWDVEQTPAAHAFPRGVTCSENEEKEEKADMPSEGNEAESDDGGRIEAEGCNADDLLEKREDGGNDREHEEQEDRLTGNSMGEHVVHQRGEGVPWTEARGGGVEQKRVDVPFLYFREERLEVFCGEYGAYRLFARDENALGFQNGKWAASGSGERRDAASGDEHDGLFRDSREDFRFRLCQAQESVWAREAIEPEDDCFGILEGVFLAGEEGRKLVGGADGEGWCLRLEGTQQCSILAREFFVDVEFFLWDRRIGHKDDFSREDRSILRRLRLVPFIVSAHADDEAEGESSRSFRGVHRFDGPADGLFPFPNVPAVFRLLSFGDAPRRVQNNRPSERNVLGAGDQRFGIRGLGQGNIP